MIRIDITKIKQKLLPAVEAAESLGVTLLIETCGEFSQTQKALDLIREFESASVGVCWDIRETFFNGKETADQTIQTLGAYICCRGTLKGALVNLIATSMFSYQNIGGLEIETEAIEYIIPLISLSGTWSECRLYDEL